MAASACCDAICKTVIQEEDEWKIGRNKIFLRVNNTYNSNVFPRSFCLLFWQNINWDEGNSISIMNPATL